MIKMKNTIFELIIKENGTPIIKSKKKKKKDLEQIFEQFNKKYD